MLINYNITLKVVHDYTSKSVCDVHYRTQFITTSRTVCDYIRRNYASCIQTVLRLNTRKHTNQKVH
jgi:hypothetical protein